MKGVKLTEMDRARGAIADALARVDKLRSGVSLEAPLTDDERLSFAQALCDAGVLRPSDLAALQDEVATLRRPGVQEIAAMLREWARFDNDDPEALAAFLVNEKGVRLGGAAPDPEGKELADQVRGLVLAFDRGDSRQAYVRGLADRVLALAARVEGAASRPLHEALPVAPLVALADEYISGAHPDSTVAKNPHVLRDFVKWALRGAAQTAGAASRPDVAPPINEDLEFWASVALNLPLDAELGAWQEAALKLAEGVRSSQAPAPEKPE